MNNNNNASIRLGLYLVAFGFGMTLTAIAPMMPLMIEEFSLSLSQGGYFTLFNNLGGALGILLAAIFGDRLKKSRFFYAGFFTLFVGMMLTGALDGYALLLAVFLVMGVGGRIVDVMGNPLITENYPQNTGKYLNLLHMFIGVGGLVSPLLVSLLLTTGIRWKTVFLLIGLICALLYVISLFLVRNTAQIAQIKSQSGGLRAMLYDPVLWIICAISFAYSGHQVILNVWAPMFMSTRFAAPPVLASLSTSLFWLGITLGRMITSRFATLNNTRVLVSGGSFLGGIVLLMGILLPSPMFAYVAFLTTGLLTGAILPLLINAAVSRHPEYAGRASSAVMLFSIAAVMSFPWLCGALADRFSFTVGMSVSSVALFVACMLSFALPKVAKQT